jgi:predicted metal-dependent peptidase
MRHQQLNSANNEALAVMQQLGLDEVWFMDADTQVHTYQRLHIKDIPKVKPTGRGGTSFIEPLEKAAKLRPKPDVVIYLTDGDGFAPKKRPSAFETVWCIVPTPHGSKPANWGHLVVCSNDQKLHEPYR